MLYTERLLLMLNKMQKLRQSREEGFTLIELLIVIVIIGVLAAIALPIFMNQQKAAIKASIKSDVRNLLTVTQTYLVKNPRATDLIFLRKGDEAPSSNSLSSNPLFSKISASDPNAWLKIRGPVTSDIIGSWDGYAVLGYIDILDSDRWLYAYNSKTGKFTEYNQPIPAVA